MAAAVKPTTGNNEASSEARKATDLAILKIQLLTIMRRPRKIMDRGYLKFKGGGGSKTNDRQ